MKFSAVVGQEELKNRLRRGVAEGRIPHAQMFIGAQGSGNLSLALAYAQYISCAARTENDSCGECPSCRKMQTLTHPDLHFSFPFPSNKGDVATELYAEWREAVLADPLLTYEAWMQALGAENKQGNIPIKECHAIIRNLSLKPYEAEYKMLVMWLPEYLGNEGNVLLKLIEEPPQKTLFLLVPVNTDKILTTIISRTQPVRVPPVDDDAVANWLMETAGMAKEDAARIALMAGGSLVRARELSDNAENQFLQPFRKWMGWCYKRQFHETARWAEDFGSSGREELKGFFTYSLEIIRAVVVHGHLGERSGLSEAEQQFVQKFSSLIDLNRADHMYKLFSEAFYETERNGNARMILTNLSFKIGRIIST